MSTRAGTHHETRIISCTFPFRFQGHASDIGCCGFAEIAKSTENCTLPDFHHFLVAEFRLLRPLSAKRFFFGFLVFCSISSFSSSSSEDFGLQGGKNVFKAEAMCKKLFPFAECVCQVVFQNHSVSLPKLKKTRKSTYSLMVSLPHLKNLQFRTWFRFHIFTSFNGGGALWKPRIL